MQKGHLEHGFEGAAVRRSCALPLSWGLPGDGLLNRVVNSAALLADRRRTPRRSDEAKLRATGLVLLALQTGRPLAEWSMLSVRRIDELAAGLDCPGAIITNKGAYLIMPSSGVHRPGLDQTDKYRPISAHIVLPLVQPLRRIIERLIPKDAPSSICFLGDGEDIAVRQLLRGDGEWRLRTTKAERRSSSTQRWLRHRLRVIEGGDPALFAILDPTRQGAERTVSSYSTVPAALFWRLYRAAIAPLDPTVPLRPPTVLSGRFYGNHRCPADPALLTTATEIIRRAAEKPERQARSWNGARPSPAWCDRHLMMMMRCYVAVTFGTGQRGIGRLARLVDIDADSGFAWVVEKSNPAGGYGGGRGVFHPRAVRRHLAAYEDYLDALATFFDKHHPAAARQLANLRGEPGVTFFSVKRDDSLVRLSQSELCRAAQRIGWYYSPNAGRRWLRSALIGQVPSDAMAAQFGHHLDGVDVWNHHSGLRPRLVAAALEPVIHQAMAGIGLHLLPKTKRPHVPLPDPADVPGRDNQRFRGGRILASAIWNGAMLDQRREAALVAGLADAATSGRPPTWIDFGLEERFDQPRWHIDETTRALLIAHHQQGFPPISGKPERLLAEFLGSPATVPIFRQAAVERWRWRLPPLLLAKARGVIVNHSVRDESFYSGQRALVKRYGKRPRDNKRNTCSQLICYIEKYWGNGPRSRRSPLGHYRREFVWECKRRVHQNLIADLPSQPFFGRMTPLERSLALGLIQGLVSDRGKHSPDGYTAYTQIKRAECLWRLFVPLLPADWEARSIDQLDVGTLSMAMFPLVPWRNDVASDLLAVLRALPETSGTLKIIAHLENREENYTANLIHPGEYEKLRRDPTPDEPWIMPALTLCYRTGMRYSELSNITDGLIHADKFGPAGVTLDHCESKRLKTFHSRRYIPLDLLLDDTERQILAKFLRHQGAKSFSRFPKTDHVQLNARLDRVTKVHVGIYPFRHAFATNALAALLWPAGGDETFTCYFDPLLLARRQAFRDRLCGDQSLGATAPHALACLMGHTSPNRTLFSYVHHLEIMLAMHVKASAGFAPALALSTPCFRPRRMKDDCTLEAPACDKAPVAA